MISVVLQIISVLVTISIAAFVLVSVRKRPAWIDDFLIEGAKMINATDEDGKNLIDHLAERFGKGFRMSLLAQKSGEARHQKMIESRVFEAVKNHNPELKLGLAALDKLGLGDLATPENLPALMQIGQKYGLFEMFLKGNNPGANPGSSVGQM